MRETIIETKNITREFKNGAVNVKALKGVSIEIQKGKLTILKGRSGAGKTTLMNIMATMDSATSGEIIFDGENISEWSTGKKDELRRTRMGIVFQSGALISTLTAFENIELGCKISGKKIKNLSKRIEEVLDLVGMKKRQQHFPYELSGGEAQRIAIARGIIHKPEVLFVDEPTSALDSKTAVKVVRVFKNLIENEGISIVMTTHDPSMIEIADRVYTLNDGVVVNE